ncbi:phosphotransferase [Candidatus Beckwithbacteria bacterium]|nr:phosphotransferase [Candidatus Beckwithbacteria bacterium]
MSKNPSKQNHFPKTVGKYRFKAIAQSCNHQTSYRYAWYENNQGRQAIAKMWSGNIPNLDRYWIANDLLFHQLFNQLSRQERLNLQKKYPNILIPKLLHFIVKPTRIVILFEKIDCVTVNKSNLSAKQKISLYENVFAYLHHLGQVQNKAVFSKLKKRGMNYNIGTFVAFAVKALLQYPKKISELWSAISIFFASTPLLLTHNELALAHRDIGDYNLLVAPGNKVYIIDFQLTVLTHPLFEIIDFLTDLWEDQDLFKLFWQSQTIQTILKTPKQKQIFKALAIYAIFLELTAVVDANQNSSLKFLHHILTI